MQRPKDAEERGNPAENLLLYTSPQIMVDFDTQQPSVVS